MTNDVLTALFDRSVLLLNFPEAEQDEISRILGNFRCRVEFLDDAEITTDDLHVDFVMICSVNSLGRSLHLVEQIRARAEKSTMIFMVAPEATPDDCEDYPEAFFQGVEAVFFRPLHLDDLIKGLAYSYNRIRTSPKRSQKRMPIHRTNVEIQAINKAWIIKGYAINISRGGMFVCSAQDLPKANGVVVYQLEHESTDGQRVSVSGQGVVRWLRRLPEFGRPPGFGIEFKELLSDDVILSLRPLV